MNFKLNSQHILQIALLIAVVLLAIYLVKSTLEGSKKSKFIDCVKSPEATIETCNYNDQTVGGYCMNPVSKLEECKASNHLWELWCSMNPKATLDKCMGNQKAFRFYCANPRIEKSMRDVDCTGVDIVDTWISAKRTGQGRIFTIKKVGENQYQLIKSQDVISAVDQPNAGGRSWNTCFIKKLEDNLYEFKYVFMDGNSITAHGKIIDSELVVCLKELRKGDTNSVCRVIASYKRSFFGPKESTYDVGDTCPTEYCE